MRRNAERLAAGVVAVVVLAGCGYSAGDLESGGTIPRSTASDWVTYGDAFITFTVTGSGETALDADEVASGTGMSSRTLDITVDSVEWERPSRATGPELPSSLEIGLGGWLYNDGDRERWTPDSGIWPKIGSNYASLVIYSDAGLDVVDPETRQVASDPRIRADWLFFEIAPVDFGRLRSSGADASAFDDAVRGRTVGHVGRLLGSTAPDPAALRYIDEDPRVRAQLVHLDR